VTNRFLALAPVVEKIAQSHGLHVLLVHDDAKDSDLRRTDWILVSPSAARLQHPLIQAAVAPIKPIPGLQPWTDDFNNLFDVLK
jgi:hypothetical protein